MGYIIRRLAQGALVLWAAFTAVFILLQALPGNAVKDRYLNPDLGLTKAQIASMQQSYGSSSPLWRQYVHTLADFFTGNLGDSLQSGTPVSTLIGSALPNTLVLAALSLVFGVVIAVGLAFLSFLVPFAWLRNLIQSLPSLFVAVPVFWLGIMLIQVFSFQLRLVPIIDPGPVQGLILPVATIAIPISTPLAQVLIRSIDETQLAAFVTVVAAKGASRSWILMRDVARNAILPALTIAGLLFGELIGSAVVTETVYGRTGLGRVTQSAAAAQDTPVVEAIVLISAAVYVLVNLIVDLLYPVLDARLRTRTVTA